MPPIARIEVPRRLAALFALGRLLEKLERSTTAVDAQQYRSVVERLTRELQSLAPDEPFHQVLALLPAASELYENLNYAHAGLCRAPLDASMTSERAARGLLARLAGRPPG